MTRAAALLVVVATATALADDDPDLPVVTGRAAKDAPSDFRLRLIRQAPDRGGGWKQEFTYADLVMHPGDPFRVAGVPPGRYDLLADGGGLVEWRRRLDVFGDAAAPDVRPTCAPTREDSTFSGKLTLGFDGDVEKCAVSIDGRPVAHHPDGEIRCICLHPGLAWLTVDYGEPFARRYPDDKRVERCFLLTLVAGENHADVRVEPNEDVRLAIRPPRAGVRIDVRVSSLDAAPEPHERTEQIAFESAADGTLRAHRWILVPPDALTFDCVGADLPLLGLAKGKHAVRIEADGFETVERAFDVAGPTRVDVALKPLAGTFVLPVIVGRFWIVEERDADGSWTPALTWNTRDRACSYEDPPPPRLFLRPGAHILRAAKDDAPPSAPIAFAAGADGATRPLDFDFPIGRALRGSVVTPSGAKLDGFMGYCFERVGERWERRRAQDVAIEPGFRVAGLAPGRYRLAFDEDGKHVFAEFDMGDADVERTFTFRAR